MWPLSNIKSRSCFSRGSATSWHWESTCVSQGFRYFSWWDEARWDWSASQTGWDWAGCKSSCCVGQVLILLTEHLQSKHVKGGKGKHMLSPRRMWDTEKYQTGCEIQRFREMALLVSVKPEAATLRETWGATMQRKKEPIWCGHFSECNSSKTSTWQKFPRWRCYCFERNYLLQGSSNPPNHLYLNVLFLSTL